MAALRIARDSLHGKGEVFSINLCPSPHDIEEPAMEALAFVFALGFLSLTSTIEADLSTAAVQEEQTESVRDGLELRRQRIYAMNRLSRELRLAGLSRKRDEGPEKVLIAQR